MTTAIIPATSQIIKPVKQLNEPDFLERVEFFRFDGNRKLKPDEKAKKGQFLTPAAIARFMASMFEGRHSVVNILDAGAGVGSLSSAYVADLCNRTRHPREIKVTAYEIDKGLAQYLPDTLELCRRACVRSGIKFSSEIQNVDFIKSATEMLKGDLFSSIPPQFNCAILNPPYRKIHSGSEHRLFLHQLGIETTNLYTAFLALVIRLLEPGGELVAITPRSFCNGTYFKGFREFFLQNMSIRRLHLFESRQLAFREDEVLQENIIFHAIKGTKKAEKVLFTSSIGPEDELIFSRTADYDQVVRLGDPQLFIHIVPDEVGQQIMEKMENLPYLLAGLGLTVSTGRVVEFRAKQFIRPIAEKGTIPLIYPAHFDQGHVTWPKKDSFKPNSIILTQQTRDLLVPNENYVLIRRFSSKEEKRRIVAAVYDASCIPGSSVGFENHLNYIHCQGKGLDSSLAKGLTVFLNSTWVDLYFRQFSGHTQVNATDLRSIKFPSINQLKTLGSLITEKLPEQDELDHLVEKEIFFMPGKKTIASTKVKKRIEEALKVIKDLGLPKLQHNERSALTLLALLNLNPNTPWSEASDPLCGITPMMEFFDQYYGKKYAPNTRETVRRQTVHQFLDAGIIVENPDKPERPVNSPRAVYRIESSALNLIKTFGTIDWEKNVRVYLTSVKTLQDRYAQERAMTRIPVKIFPGKDITLSPGGQNVLVKQIIEEFAARFCPGGQLLYVGDTDKKFAYFDKERLESLGVRIETHGKMPDVIIHHAEKPWLILVEAVTSHGPVNPKRRDELNRLFQSSKVGLVFVTAFLTRRAMVEYLNDISWETEVWVAESPSHLIHFNGERFLGPY